MMKIFSKLLLLLGFFMFAGSAMSQDQVNTKTVSDENTIIMQTNFGDIVIALDEVRAPKTVANFKKYMKTGFYKNVVFHRVISNFMIQAGGFTEKMQKKTATFTVENESIGGLPNVRGSIAMARTSAPHSASSQFFINVQDNPSLDSKGESNFGYAVFGQVIEGMDVVDRIKEVKTKRFTPPYPDSFEHFNYPVESVVIERVYFKGQELSASNKIQMPKIDALKEDKPKEQTKDEANSSGFVTLLFSLIAFLFVSIRKVLLKCPKLFNCKDQEES